VLQDSATASGMLQMGLYVPDGIPEETKTLYVPSVWD